jgi:aminoethylphosphonate catabolism LysR family transcriptional regulator
MRYTQLRSFHWVARSGGFTGAARAIRVSQPALTQQVRQLERDFGVELFQRRGRRVVLTETGHGLLTITQRMFAQEAEALTFLDESRDLRSGHLRIGAVAPFHVMDMLAAFNARYPGVHVSVALGNSRAIVQGLLDYATDVAVLAHIDPDRRLTAIPYSRNPVVVMAPAGHRLARRRSIRLAELDGQAMIHREQGSTTRRSFEAALTHAGVAPRFVMEIGSREAVREAVAKGIGLGVVSAPEFVPGPELVALKVSDAAIFTEQHLVHLAERREARLVRAFLEVATLPAKRRRGAQSSL